MGLVDPLFCVFAEKEKLGKRVWKIGNFNCCEIIHLIYFVILFSVSNGRRSTAWYYISQKALFPFIVKNTQKMQ